MKQYGKVFGIAGPILLLLASFLTKQGWAVVIAGAGGILCGLAMAINYYTTKYGD